MTLEEIAQLIVDFSLDHPDQLTPAAAQVACDALGFQFVLFDKHPTVVDIGNDEPLYGGEGEP